MILNRVIDKYQLLFPKANINLLDFTIFRQKRNIADIIRLQLYGVLWSGSGIDQDYPDKFTPAQRDFEKDDTYKNIEKKVIKDTDLGTDVIIKGISGFPKTDFILINEPILISSGKNSEIRYNFYYPRWAYDTYRKVIKSTFTQSQIPYYDFWDLVPESEFTNSAIHLTAKGEEIFADKIDTLIRNHCEQLGKK